MPSRSVAFPLALSLAASLCISGEASATTLPLTKLAEPLVAKTYSGCPVPATPTQAFYVDPVNGSNSGDGSQAHPWHTLAEVIGAGLISTMPSHYDNTTHQQLNNNPNAPIKPGSIVYLMSGNHGKVLLQGWLGVGTALSGYDNSSFITIAAAPGQTPVLTQLSVLGGNMWAFRGLTIQSLNTSGQYMTTWNGVYNDYWLASFTGPHNNIIFDNNHLLSQANVSTWGITDWQQNRASGIVEDKGSCIAITNNTLENVGFGMTTQDSNKILIGNNTIDYFSDDALDYGSSNMLIVGNVITNSVEDGDGFHRDGMQGQPAVETTILHNITIKKNTVIRVTDPALKFPATLQGIGAFDGVWNNIVVTGNVVITKATQGISYYNVHNGTFTSNIVLSDGGKSYNCDFVVDATTFQQCLTVSITYDTSNILSLNISPGKVGTVSSNVTIQGNTLSSLSVAQSTTPLTMLSNQLTGAPGKALLAIPINGSEYFSVTPGTYSGNTILPGDPTTVFRTFDNTNMLYDLRLK
jgi:hypothetical protein